MINDELARIQQALHVEKGQKNDFGKYNYRSCSDILQAVKPHLTQCTVLLTDTIVAVGERVYVKATASLVSGTETICVDGWAREASTKKGMDDAQITGAASSYARKYALNGLFAIDDTKDDDALNEGGLSDEIIRRIHDGHSKGADNEAIAARLGITVNDVTKELNK